MNVSPLFDISDELFNFTSEWFNWVRFDLQLRTSDWHPCIQKWNLLRNSWLNIFWRFWFMEILKNRNPFKFFYLEVFNKENWVAHLIILFRTFNIRILNALGQKGIKQSFPNRMNQLLRRKKLFVDNFFFSLLFS